MGERAQRFWDELAAAYKSAGRPTLARLVHLGKQQTPQVDIAVSTLHDWLNGRTVPGRDHDRYVMALVDFLQQEAARKESGFARRPEGRWQQLLAVARQEREAARGRPATRAASPAPPPGSTTLPPDLAGFTGRAAELDLIL
ncbi:hypothetical protein [Streptomyces virginiae]